jgi:hypothetical protein
VNVSNFAAESVSSDFLKGSVESDFGRQPTKDAVANKASNKRMGILFILKMDKIRRQKYNKNTLGFVKHFRIFAEITRKNFRIF